MADQNSPNDASRKSQAEGDRWSPEGDMSAANRPGSPTARPSSGGQTDAGDDEAGGITNRPLAEEQENQDAVPDRGESKPGAHAGHGGGHSDPQERQR